MIRKNADGSIWIPRSNKQVEDQLDLQYDRVPGQRIWFPKVKSRNWDELKTVFKNQTVNIVGKGPSLDRIKKENLLGFPTIAINEAIHQIEAIGANPDITFGITQDSGLKDRCRPNAAGLFCNLRIAYWYADYHRLWIFTPEQFGLGSTELSAIVAGKIAEYYGATRLRMLCFDAAINRDVAYAKVTQADPSFGGPPSRFLNHWRNIVKELKLPLDLVQL